jgi:transposase
MMKATFDGYYYGINGLEEKLRMMEKRIEERLVSKPYVQGFKKLRCFKGVEYLTALSIICEVVWAAC